MNGSWLDIIARIETPFAEKFGVPRQSGIADSPGRIVFEKPFRRRFMLECPACRAG